MNSADFIRHVSPFQKAVGFCHSRTFLCFNLMWGWEAVYNRLVGGHDVGPVLKESDPPEALRLALSDEVAGGLVQSRELSVLLREGEASAGRSVERGWLWAWVQRWQED